MPSNTTPIQKKQVLAQDSEPPGFPGLMWVDTSVDPPETYVFDTNSDPVKVAKSDHSALNGVNYTNHYDNEYFTSVDTGAQGPVSLSNFEVDSNGDKIDVIWNSTVIATTASRNAATIDFDSSLNGSYLSIYVLDG